MFCPRSQGFPPQKIPNKTMQSRWLLLPTTLNQDTVSTWTWPLVTWTWLTTAPGCPQRKDNRMGNVVQKCGGHLCLCVCVCVGGGSLPARVSHCMTNKTANKRDSEREKQERKTRETGVRAEGRYESKSAQQREREPQRVGESVSLPSRGRTRP